MADTPWLSDPYWKLKPIPATPADEICACPAVSELLLRARIGPNPLACAACNREVVVERIGISAELAELVATWCSFFECFYMLWLDSGEFEQWARQELEAPASVANRRGLAVRERMASVAPTFYWWFQDTGEEGFVARATCPKCEGSLQPYRDWLACFGCYIVVAN